MKLRHKIGLVLGVLGITFALGRCGRTQTNGPKVSIPAVLPVADIEQIKVNPETHQLTIRTSKGLQTVTLPDRTSTIDILKNGSVKISSPQFGFERHMFVGFIASDNFRIGAGLDGLYYKKLDLGVGIADRVGAYTPIVFAKMTYNITGSLQAGLVYGSNQYVGGIVSLRVF